MRSGHIRRTQEVAAATLVVALSMVGCSSTERSTRAGKPAQATGTVTATAAGPTVTAAVGPGRRLELHVPSVGTIRGGPDAFTSAGTVTATPMAASVPETTGYHIAGKGVDVSFEGAKLHAPLQVSFGRTGAQPPPNSLPGVLHRRHDGSWEVKAASVDAAGDLFVTTTDFSINLPAFIDVRAWVGHFFDSIVDALGARTDPDPCPNDGPRWASLRKGTTLVHTCLISNRDGRTGAVRAEAQLKSNRRFYQWVSVPAGYDYLWVDNQPHLLSHLLGQVFHYDPGSRVLLDGGTRMTAGFRQPSARSTPTFTSYLDGWTSALSLAASVLELFGLDPRKALLAGTWLTLTCADKIPSSMADVDASWEFFRCMVTKPLDTLRNDEAAFAAAVSLFGENAYTAQAADALKRTKSSLHVLGIILRIAGLASIVRDAWAEVADAFSQMGSDRPGEVVLSLAPHPSTGGSSPTAGTGSGGGQPQPGGGRPSGPLSLSIIGSCTTAGGTLAGRSYGFTPGGTATIRAWYPDGREYANLVHASRVRTDGSIRWTWPCAGDPAGAYTTEAVDRATGRSTGRIPFTIGAVPAPSPAPTLQEQSGTHGSPTFLDPTNASGPGERIPAMAYVQVSCRRYAPGIASANPDGWWYRIASSPWNNRYYAVANPF